MAEHRAQRRSLSSRKAWLARRDHRIWIALSGASWLVYRWLYP